MSTEKIANSGHASDYEAVVTPLGGPSAVARSLGVKPNVVSNWRSRGIPKGWSTALAAKAPPLKQWTVLLMFIDCLPPVGAVMTDELRESAVRRFEEHTKHLRLGGAQ